MLLVIIALTAVALMPLVLSSLFICAPKWYRAVVEPRTPSLPDITTPWKPVNKTFDYLSTDVRDVPWLVWPARVVGILVVAIGLVPFTLVLWLVVAWISSCVTLITNKCPYTAPSERRLSISARLWGACKRGPVYFAENVLFD